MDSGSRGLVFGAASHGSVRGGIVGILVKRYAVVVFEWWCCLSAHVLESFSLARFMRAVLVLMDLN